LGGAKNGKKKRIHWEMMAGRDLMGLFFWSVVGGLVGTGLMDIVGSLATAKLKIRWGG
jgi:hypothetical protein